MFENSKRVWLNSADEKNCYVDLSEKFNAKVGESYIFHISANSNYAVYINGEYADAGQYADYAEWRSYDSLDISKLIKNGENQLLITVYWQGEDSSCYRLEPAGAVYELRNNESVLVSGDKTLARKNTNYISSPCPHVSGQLGFTISYDSRKVCNSFQKADAFEINPKIFHPRPIKKLALYDNQKGKIMTQGVFKVSQKNDENFGREVMHSYNSFREGHEMRNPHEYIQYLPSSVEFKTEEDCDGIYFLIDYQAENTGFFSIDIEVEEDTLILAGYGCLLYTSRCV